MFCSVGMIRKIVNVYEFAEKQHLIQDECPLLNCYVTRTMVISSIQKHGSSMKDA